MFAQNKPQSYQHPLTLAYPYLFLSTAQLGGSHAPIPSEHTLIASKSLNNAAVQLTIESYSERV